MHIFLDGLETFRMIWKLSGWSGNFLDGLETFRMIWKLSRWFGNFWIIWKLSAWSGNFPNDLETFGSSGNFPDGLKTFRMIWKLSGWSGNFPDGLETFRMIWKWSGNVLYFPDDLKTFWMIWKLSGWFGNFPDDKFFQKRIYVNVAKTIDPLFWCICRENNLRAPSRKFLRVKGLFTYYVSRRRGGGGTANAEDCWRGAVGENMWKWNYLCNLGLTMYS